MMIINTCFRIAFVSLIILFSACNKDDPTLPLIADAGPDQVVKPLDMVTLDGSGSSGPEGFTYSWKYSGTVPEVEIDFQNPTSASPTFVPPEAGLYTFSLTIASGGQTNENVILVEAKGALTIGGTLEVDTNLKNIEDDPDLPDYLIESDLVIPEGITLTIENDVKIEVAQEKGIVVNGTLTNASNDDYFEDIELISTNGWKGILIDGGTINLSGVIVEKAGASFFDGQNEAAAMLFSGNPSQIIELSRNEFKNSASYDILGEAEVSGYRSVTSNEFSYSIPIKARMSFMDNFFSDEKNIFPQDYDYIQLIPSGLETADVLPEDRYYFFYHKRYFIDGSFRSGSEAFSTGGITFFMKENSSLIFEKQTSLGSNSTESSTIAGINGASWNGIAALNEVSLKLNNMVISNAGAAPVVGGTVQSKVKAVVYQQGRGTGWLKGVTITDTEGYGIYLDAADTVFSTFQVSESKFQNTGNAAIRTNGKSFMQTIGSGNSFVLSDNVPGCLIEQDGSPLEFTWPSLGSSFYLIDADINFGSIGIIKFAPGVHLKFKSNRSLNWNLGYEANVLFQVEGEIDNPVIFEGETNTPGSWGGLVLAGNININYLQVKNGGAFLLTGASTKANIFFDYTINGGLDFFKIFTNNQISGSDGYGIVLSNAAIVFDFEDPGKNNSFLNNNLGNVFRE